MLKYAQLELVDQKYTTPKGHIMDKKVWQQVVYIEGIPQYVVKYAPK